MKKIRSSPAPELVLLAVIIAWAGWGCGYRPAGSAVPDDVHIAGLAFSVVESSSSSLGFESEFTRNIRQEFISFSRVPLMSEAEAPYVLECRVTHIGTRPLRFSPTRTTVQGRDYAYWRTSSRELSIAVDARLVESATGKVVWQDYSIVETAIWNIGADPLKDREAQRQAIRRAAGRIASQLYSRTMARF